ncbi:MAG: type II toxin-antitoxin system HicA family toxin [Candidatus Bipolaricaulia bacterium]
MRKLPPISGRDLVKELERFGFLFVRQRGSHMILRREGHPPLTVCVPDHRELKRETLANILRCAGVKREDLDGLE